MYKTLTKSISALVALGALVIGVPVALVMLVGWPLPTSIPNPSDITTALSIGNIPTAVIINMLACIVWIAWAQIAYSVVAEALASIRGRVAQPARLIPAPLQLSVGRLVATAALAFTLLPRNAPVVAAAPIPPLRTTPVVMTIDVEVPPTVVTTSDPFSGSNGHANHSAAEQPAPASRTWTVKRGDNLWDIAAATLGSGERFIEIFELNHGVPQPDGRTLTDPGVLELGWTLQLPTDPIPPATDTAPPSAPATPIIHTVQRGESLSLIARHYFGDGNRWTEVFQANYGSLQPDGRTVTDPNVLEPDWILAVPTPRAKAVDDPLLDNPPADPAIAAESSTSTDGARPTPPAPPSSAPTTALEPGPTPPPTLPFLATTLTTPSAPEGSSSPLQISVPANDTTEAGPSAAHPGATSLPILGAGAGILAAGTWTAVRRARQRQSARRRPGTESPELSADAASVLGEIRGGALDAKAHEIAAIIAALGHDLDLRRGRTAPQPLAVIVRDNNLELMLDGTWFQAPVGWSASENGRTWTTPLRPLPPDGDDPCPAPALVTIGGTTREPVLLDVEAAGVISITGEQSVGENLVRSIATELAESPFAETACVIVVGLDLPVTESDRLLVTDDLDAALDQLEADAEQYRRALSEGDVDSAFAARAMDIASDGFPPTVLITTIVDERVNEIAADLPSRAGVALIVKGELNAPALEIRIDDDRLEIPELGLRCTARSVSAEAAELIANVLVEVSADPIPVDDDLVVSAFVAALGADSGSVVACDMAPSTVRLDTRDAQTSPYEDPPYDLCVRLLGPIDVDGAPAKLSQQQTAVLAFLVTHAGAAKFEIAEALWHDDQPSKARLSNLLYQLRRIVGGDLLPATTGGSQPVGAGLVSDLQLFEARLDAASKAEPDDALRILHDALDLVRGPVLSYSNRAARFYGWVDLENFTSIWERKVGDVAHRVTTQWLEKGQTSLALEAVVRGLRAIPLCETLVCDLITVHGASGDLHAARTAMEEYERCIDSLGLGEPADTVAAMFDAVASSLRVTNRRNSQRGE